MSLREGKTTEVEVTVNYSPFYWASNVVDHLTSLRLRVEVEEAPDEWMCSEGDHSWVVQLVFDASSSALSEQQQQYMTITNCGIIIDRWGPEVQLPVRLKVSLSLVKFSFV